MMALLTLLVLLLASPVSAAVYYVSTTGSGSTCSLGSPCGSIQTGIGKLSAGDTLYLRGGTYTQSNIDSSVYTIPSGTDFSTGAVTIAGYPGETVILYQMSIRFPAGSSNQYIIFQNMDLNCAGTECNLYFIAPVNHLRFDHVNIYDSTTSSNGAGMVSGNAPYIEFLHMQIHGAGYGNCAAYSNQGCYGLYINGNHLLMDDCDVYNNAGNGMTLYHSQAGGGPADVTDNVIRNSRFYDNGFNDARGFTGNGALVASGARNQFYNNVLWNNSGSALSVNYNCNDCEVYNNTIVDNLSYGMEFNGSTGIKAYNNIAYRNGNFAVNEQLVDWVGNVDAKNNTLAVDPLFTNRVAHDYTLQAGSSAIDTGLTVSAVTTDKNGVTRPQGSAYDRGAYEYTGNAGPTPTTIYVQPSPTGDDSRSCVTASNINTPRRTIAGGLGCLVLSGSTLYLRAGTYVETIDTNSQFIPAGTSWSAATSIRAYGNEVVTIQVPTGSSNPSLLYFRNATTDHYIILDRLIADCNNVSGSNAFVTYPGTHHIRFQNGEMKNCFFEGAFLYYSNNVEILSSLIHGNPNYYGIGLAGTIDGVIINKNEIYSNGRGGIDLMKDPSGVPTNTTITQNKIHNNSTSVNSSGIRLGSTGNTGNQVYNNLLYSEYEGITVGSGAASSKIYNNTVYGSTSNGINIMAGATGTLLKNSISYGNSGTAILDNGTSTTQTTNQTTDPTFTSTGSADFTLVNTSTAIDTGTNVAEVTIDIIDVPRPQRTTQSKGAYEFVGTPGTPPPPPPPAGSARYSTAWRPRFMFHR